MASRTKGERIRIDHQLSRLKGVIKALEIALKDEEHPPSYDTIEALSQTTNELCISLAKLEAYDLAEKDLVKVNKDNSCGDSNHAWESKKNFQYCKRCGVCEMTNSMDNKAFSPTLPPI
jgi:hypothetical protein